MAPTMKAQSPQVKLLKVLAHPVRLSILGVLSCQDVISPAGYARASREDVSNVAYHFRNLAKGGCVEVVGTKPARGSTEHFYRRTRPALFDDEMWPTLPPAAHVALSHTIVHDLFGRIRRAFKKGTFDARVDRHLTWTPMSVDRQGWDSLTLLLMRTFEQFDVIQEESSERMAASGEESIEVTAALLGFESPKHDVM